MVLISHLLDIIREYKYGKSINQNLIFLVQNALIMGILNHK